RRAPAARSSTASARSSASRSRSRCSTTRSSAPTTRACTTASGSSPTRSRSCRSTRRSPPRSPAPSRRNRASTAASPTRRAGSSPPIAEIDAAIRQLGGADFSRPIAVRGPEDLRYLGRRLDWLRRRLDEFETQKNRFLRHVSHELKTPLTALREGAELLHDQVAGPLAPPQRQVVAIMRDNSV